MFLLLNLIYLCSMPYLVKETISLQITMTAKIKIMPSLGQMALLQQTLRAYRNGCNFVFSLVFETKELV